MDAQQPSTSGANTVKLAGALSGVVQLASSAPTVAELRAEAARLAGCAPECIKLICGGKTLQDDSKMLSDYGVTPTSRVLVTKGAGAAAALGAAAAAQQQQAAREARLEKLKSVVEKLSGRGDGRGLTDKYEFDLQNQDGSRLVLAPADRKALVMGLALHAKGQATLAAATRAARAAAAASGSGSAGAAAPAGGAAEAAAGGGGGAEGGAGAAGGAGAQLRQALEELLMAEEAFDLVGDKQLLQSVDNVAMLLLDIVWCCYLLRDAGRLGVSAERLARARAMLTRAHGPNMERARRLRGGFSPESATYVRLEAMEGVVAFHVGDRAAAARHLQAAQQRYDSLQVSPESLALLREMGYRQQESARALRFCGGDVAASVAFIAEQCAKQQERAADRRRQRDWLRERAAYGRTASGAYVDAQPLGQLATLGYDKGLAAEALRAADNDLQAALDTLADPVKAGALQLAMLAQQIKETEEGPQDVKARHVARLVEMGFADRDARVALKEAGGSFSAAAEALAARAGGGGAPAGGGGGGGGAPAGGGGGGGAPAGGAGASAGAPAAGRGRRRRRRAGGRRGGGGAAPGGANSGSEYTTASSASEVDSEEERMERSLVDSVKGGSEDPTAAYDVDLEEEAEAIRRYAAALQGGPPPA